MLNYKGSKGIKINSTNNICLTVLERVDIYGLNCSQQKQYYIFFFPSCFRFN